MSELPDTQLKFRPLEKEDFKLFAYWLSKPHVNKWWREPATVEHVSADYGDCTRGDFTTRVFVVQAGEKPIGIIQVFALADFPEYERLFSLRGAVSIDYLIGEEDYIGRGYGTRMISDFIHNVVRKLYPNTSGVTTSALPDNIASLRALEKAGFTAGNLIEGEYGLEREMTLTFFDIND